MTGLAEPGRAGRPEPSRRLFFALWPSPDVARCLAGAVSDLVPPGTGKPQRCDQLHATVEFLGSVPEAHLATVIELGGATAAAGTPCEVVLDRVEHWRRPQVLCLTGREVPAALAALVEDLRAQLRRHGFEPEAREFRVHVTLARKVRRAPAPAAIQAIRWPVRDLALIESCTSPQGSRYECLASWSLGA